MQRTYVFGTMLALALTGSVYAQQDQSAASSAQKDREVTVTGCLVPGAPSATTTGTAGTAGSTSSTSSADKFMLANATITSGPGATATTTGTAGTSGTASATAPAPGPSYNLIGGAKSDLEPNLNAKVEIRGVIEPASASSPSSAAGGTMTGGTSGATGAAAKQLRVTSVRQLASTCSGGQ